MNGDVHVRFWESVGVQFPHATQQRAEPRRRYVLHNRSSAWCHRRDEACDLGGVSIDGKFNNDAIGQTNLGQRQRCGVCEGYKSLRCGRVLGVLELASPCVELAERELVFSAIRRDAQT